MLRNYLKIALRNFWRNKSFSAINVLGLALGIACSLAIFLWVRDERSVDNYHANGDRLFRVMHRQTAEGRTNAGPWAPGLLFEELKKKFPEVVSASGWSWEEEHTFAVGEKANKEKGHYAGAEWFRMFSVPVLAGNADKALDEPNDLALSRKLAENYFGSAALAVGKTIRLDNERDYRVSVVFENLPANTSEPYDYLLSWDDFIRRNEWAKQWDNNGPRTFVLLRPDADVEKVNAKLRKFLNTYRKESFPSDLFLQKFGEDYLYSDWRGGFQNGGRIEYVRLFSVVAVFILLIACINFMNLATARSERRSREVGVRKVMGAVRTALVRQFLSESVLITVLSVALAILLVLALLPTFNELTRKQISLDFGLGQTWLVLLGITLLTGLVAGSYPALYLSGFQPVQVLKGRFRFTKGAKLFRQGLVVFQFALSVLLIVGTIVVYRQVRYIQNKNLGFDRENLIYVPLEGQLLPQYDVLKQELLRMPGIQSVSRASDTPHSIGSNTMGVQWPGKDPKSVIFFSQIAIGYDFAKTCGLKFKEGREFSRAFATDSVAYLINEQALKRIGYKDPIGKPLTFWDRPGTIVGVVNDFHFQSLHVPIEPLVVRLGEKMSFGNLLVRTLPGQTKQAIASLEAVTKRLNPKFPFSYQFADDEYAKMYRSEQVLEQLSKYFAFLAVLISCLGLLGLAMFTAEQRQKEIGVRKVMGASVGSIVALLSKDFLKLVGIAFLIAPPLAWYALTKILSTYTYREEMSWWIFALAGGLAVVIAFLTVSFQSVKAALANPVKSLRAE